MLSVCLVTNLWFSLLVFVSAAWAYYSNKLIANKGLSEVERVWYAAILGFWMVQEAPRLALGFRGNQSQSGALMFAFLALTAFAHTIMMLAYVFIIPDVGPVDVALGTVELIFASLEIIFGLNAMSTLVTANTIDFYVGLKVTDDGDLSNNTR